MAVQQDRGVPLSTLSPKYLHTNSTSHTWPFSAIAELIDNAYDPDVLANAFWIDKTVVKGHDCLSFMDNGNGLDHEAMHKMLSFGYSDKVSVKGVEPIGMYGNGFKSGSMRLGRDAIVFSRSKNASCVGMLSQTYLEKINAQQIIVPIVCFEHTDGNLCVREEHRASLQDILHYSPFVTETDLLTEISAITSTCSTATTGTRIIIWNLRRTSTEALEFDFQADRYDIQIPSDVYEDLTSAGDRIPSHIPESVYSLRPNSKGVGVIGVIECNFLEPMHNKQSFSENDKYRKTMASLTIKLDEYCNEIRYRLTRDNPDRKVEVDDISKRADQNWVMCDLCRKWRKLPDGIDCSRLPDSWFCHMNPDPQFRNCEAEEEAQDSDDEQPSYRKTYKQKEREDKKKLMSKQKVEADRRRWEERRMAKLTLQNQALRQQEEDLKRKLHQKTVHSPTTPTTSERRLNMDSVQETSSSPGVTAVSGTSPSSNGFPIISSVYSLSTSPSRKKRRMSAESQSTPKSHRQNLFQEGASDGSSSVDVSPLRNEAFEPKEFMGLVNEGSSSPAPPPGISQMEAPQIKGEKEDKAIIKQNPDQTECGAVATAERGTQFSRMIKRENNTQSINESNQTVYIASDDDNEITESLEWPMETKEQQDVDHEERLENILPFTVNCLHQSSQTEETLPDKDYKSLFEKAEEKIHQLVSSRADLLETARIKPSATQAEEDLGNITWQVDSLVRELDQRTMERNQLRSQLKNVKLEKANLSSQCQELRMRLQQAGGQTQESGSRAPLQNEDLSTQPANSPTNSEYFKRLVELRYNIGRLLVNRVPYLDLGQVNYECDVIDEILEQYLTVNSSDRSDAPCSK
ncbi:MORC family CW-type zinc finger protein 3a isoform X2 [Phyllopteryx taeniolatus]|uniref:MORC family CW-type zinc finger protein 3a isoform X2 n=1 Tax=Phyllopteryx taeniolatus TaxID=161469 RepID=UPI002AD3EB61|nr:MORC family CW-type zinc finger protein 3a isoform X2 [Phyllopteryx taeniolatus]